MSLETFPNPHPERDYLIRHVAEEFTSLCPKTGHPDHARIILAYVPDQVCVELKSYKLYLQDFRNEGIFYEAVTNKILDDLVAACAPRWMRVETIWSRRGGIHSQITVEHHTHGYTPGIDLPSTRTLPEDPD